MTGQQDFNDQNQARMSQDQQGFAQPHPGPQQQFAQPGYPHPGYAPAQPPRRNSQVGTRLVAFVSRDVPALVAAGITFVVGLLLLVTPHLPWLKDNSFDIVEGTMTFSARGSIDLSSTAQRGLSNSDALEIGFIEVLLRALFGPLAGMLTLSAVLVLLGGLLMVTTARQLGAVVAIMGVIPQIIIAVVSILGVVIAADSPRSSEPSTATSDISVGVGVYLTLAAYVIVVICAALAALRTERPRPATAATAGPASKTPGTDTHAQYPPTHPDSQQQSQQFGPEGQPPTGH